MGLIVLLLLFVLIAFGIVGTVTWREYQRAYAEVHRDIPPFASWIIRRDTDPDVEAARRLAIYTMLAGLVVLGVFGAIAYLFPRG